MAGGYVHTLAPVKSEEREKETRRLEKIEKRLAQEYGMALVEASTLRQYFKNKKQKDVHRKSGLSRHGGAASQQICAKKKDLQKLLDLRFEHTNEQSVPRESASSILDSQQIINRRKVASQGAINSVAADLQGANQVFDNLASNPGNVRKMISCPYRHHDPFIPAIARPAKISLVLDVRAHP